MMNVMKKHGKIVKAYQLGQAHPVLADLMENGKILDLENGTYEVFSQEAVKGGSGHGQLAQAGDWVRIDGAGYPYPSGNDWVRANLRPCGGDDYEQIPKALLAWRADQPMCREIQFLVDHKGLYLNEQDPGKYFNAVLWGTQEAAAKDATLVFYGIFRDDAGNIVDADFNFVEKTEFERDYNILSF